MSSDAQIRRGETGWEWTASHDGPCLPDAPDHRHPLGLGQQIAAVETCLGQELRWEVDDYHTDGTVRVRGWSA